MEDELATGGGGVNVFGEAAESDVALLKFGDYLDELLEGAAQAIQLPDDENVTAAYKLQYQKLYQNSCANARSETLILRWVLKQRVVLEG